MLRDEQEGLLYPPGDEAALAEAVLEMLRDATLSQRLTEQGYRRVRELFSSGARRRRISEVYERLMPGSQATDPWDDGFGDDETGEIFGVGSAPLLELDGSDPHALDDDRREETGEVETLDHVEELPFETTHGGPGDDATGNTELPMRVDTDPGLASEKTRPRAPDTDPGAR